MYSWKYGYWNTAPAGPCCHAGDLALTPCSHYMRPSTDGGFLTYPCVFTGCITNTISLDSVLAYVCITQSDWPTDPSLPEKFNLSQLFDSGQLDIIEDTSV